MNELTESAYTAALAALATADADLAAILSRLGPPPFWTREPGFPTLLYIILEQQVSLASACAAYERLLAIAAPLTPERFLALDDSALRAIGFSRQKATYGRQLAQAMLQGELTLDQLPSWPDETARAALLTRKGIGPWTADIYLLMALRRPDIWPAGDLALQLGLQEVKRLPVRPTAQETLVLAEPWRPWRAVAARLVWHHYLNRPKVSTTSSSKQKIHS